MKSKILFSLLLFSITGISLQAQVDRELRGDQIWGISYNIAMPNGELANFIDRTSWRGVTLEYQYFLGRQFSIGGLTGWSIFNQTRDFSTYEFLTEGELPGAGAVTAKTWSYTQVLPIQLTARYYHSADPGQRARLFLGGGIGTTFVNQELWVGLQEFVEDNWKFSAFPEAGLDFNLTSQVHFQFATQYNYVASGLLSNEDLTYWAFKLGFFWRI